MGRYKLIRSNEEWRVIDDKFEKVDVDTLIMTANSMPELLHKLQKKGSAKWYVVMDFINNRKETRREKYPLHNELHVLKGYVDSVCDFRIEYDSCYDDKWNVGYLRELWVKTDEYHMNRVAGFTNKMDLAAKQIIRDQNLKYDE